MRDLSFKPVKVFAIEKVQSKAKSGDGSCDGVRTGAWRQNPDADH